MSKATKRVCHVSKPFQIMSSVVGILTALAASRNLDTLLHFQSVHGTCNAGSVGNLKDNAHNLYA
jgi:hypothetical protein